MALCPFAVRKLIPPGSNDPRIKARAAILHVDAGNASSLFEFFRDRSGGIESHFFVKKDGTVEQYRDTGFQADANLDANDFAISIETQGFGAGEWTPQQIASIKRLLLWCSATHDFPLRKIQRWDGSGVGYHTLFGAPSHWTPVAKTCPGPDRVRQFDRVLVPWMDAVRNPRPAPKPAPGLCGGHASLRFDVSAGATANYLAALIHHERLDFLTTTEAQQPRTVELLRVLLGKGWRVQRRHEYLIAWRRDVLAARPLSPMRRRRLSRIKGLEDWRNLFIALRGLRIRATGAPLLLTVGHCPAGVESGANFRSDRPERVLASKRGLTRWGHLVRNRRRQIVVAAGDANLDQFRDEWRGYMTRVFGAPSIWANRLPKRGSHGTRLIDTAHVSGAVVTSAHVSGVDRPAGMDHRAVIYTIKEKP